MEYLFFYCSVLLVWAALIYAVHQKGINMSLLSVGLASIGFSLTFDIIFGDRLNLYYYLKPGISTLYIVLSGVLVYPPLNIIYLLFRPSGKRSILKYTMFWIVFMFIFEYLSIITRTIVFTGWRPLPWSLVAYVVTYLLVNVLYNYLEKNRCIT